MLVRVVADSNVLVSAFYGTGKPREVLDLIQRGTIELYLSPFILEEVSRVLGYKFRWEEAAITNVLSSLSCRVIDPGPAHLAVLSDEPDNRILECAVAARAHYLITGDKRVLQLRRYRRTRIVTPGDFLKVLP
jgi:putative PIN family toxin of toxin-antitoxin system